MTARNLIISLVLSLALTFFITTLYVFYPIIAWIVTGSLESMFTRDTDGTVVIAGGMSAPVVVYMVLLEIAFFLILFAFLQRISRKSLDP